MSSVKEKAIAYLMAKAHARLVAKYLPEVFIVTRQARNNEDVFFELEDFTIHAKTDAAFLVSEDGDKDKAVWLPRSQLKDVEVRLGKLTCSVPEWLAILKELV